MNMRILPSLLSANLMNLGQEVTAVMQAGADMIHLDVMDNHYVPNLTFGPLFCEALHQQFSQLMIDVHLMVKPVDALIQAFAEKGAHRISIHPDATIHLDRSLQLIKDKGCQAGLVLNPATSLEVLRWCRHHLDFVLIMTVNPGFGGQAFIQTMLQKIAAVHQGYPDLAICVDGGITPQNIAEVQQAGACEVVAGSAIFHSHSYQKTFDAFRDALV